MLEEEVASYIEMHHILLCGDFNIRAGQAPDYEVGVIDTNVKFCINTGFKIAMGGCLMIMVSAALHTTLPMVQAQ